jgi:tetratricopeptide (TPR) repeat protein
MTFAPTSIPSQGSGAASSLPQYAIGLLHRLRVGAEFIGRSVDQPEQIRKHLPSLLTLISNARQLTITRPLALHLVDALHPYPLLWGYPDIWEEHLRWAALERPAPAPDPLHARLLCYLAEAYFESRNNEALEIAQQAYQACLTAHSPIYLARSALVIACIHHDRGKIPQAAQTRQDAEKRITEICGRQVTSLKRISQAYLYTIKAILQRQAGDIPGAQTSIDAVVDTLPDETDCAGVPRVQYRIFLGETYLRRGVMAWARGDYPSASVDLNQAGKYFSALGDNFHQASVLANLGLIYWKMCLFDQAEQAQLQSIEIRKSLNSLSSAVRVVGDLGLVYYLRGDLDRAVQQIQRQLEMAKKYGDSRSEALALGNLAAVQIYHGKSDQVMEQLEQGLGRDAKSKEHELGILVDLVPCYWNLGKTEQAYQAAQRAVQIGEELKSGIPGISVPALRTLAVVQPAPQAEASLRQALALADQYNRKYDTAACLLSLAGIVPAPEREDLWQQGVAILNEMGASSWVAGRSPSNPPLLPITV